MLPTPSWLKFRRWRARKAAAAAVREQPHAALAQQQPAEAQADRLLANSSRATAHGRQLTSSCDLPAQGAGTTLATTSAGASQQSLEEQCERGSRPRRKPLAHLIPRSLSNLIGRALSPASSINQNTNNTNNNSNNSTNTSSEQGHPPARPPRHLQREQQQQQQQRERQSSENEMTTSNAGCCLKKAPDLIAQAGERPMSPLRKLGRHLACGQAAESGCNEAPASDRQRGQTPPLHQARRRQTNEEEQALETKTQATDATAMLMQQQEQRQPLQEADQDRARANSAIQRGAKNGDARQEADCEPRKCQAGAAAESPANSAPRGQPTSSAEHGKGPASQLGERAADSRCGWMGAGPASPERNAARLIAEPPPASANQAASCHLTARTRDNQCALHGSSLALDASASCPQEPLPSRAAAAAASRDLKKARAAPSDPEPLAVRDARTARAGQSWRRSRKTPRTLAKSVPTWPLAKQTLDNNLASELQLGHFGDAEDLLSAHLAGRLFGALTADDHSHETTAAPPPPPPPPPRKLADQLRSLNYNHKRPFARAYETPSTGFLFNATGLPPINAGSSATLKDKLFASSGFRRRSYDDQEGDNDFNIILQPSDIDDIERKAKASYAQFRGNLRESETARVPPPSCASHNDHTQQLLANNNNNHLLRSQQQQQQQQYISSKRLEMARARHKDAKLTALTSLFDDIKLAKCLLDQDYNQTVRLFIERSALNWNFNSFTFDALCCGRSLTELLLHLFDFYNLYATFQLDIIKVLKCFRLLEFGYHSTNPYHNSVHAADVTQAMHCFIQEQKIRRHMTDLEVLCSILGAVCHDLDHPGVNQGFLVATKNPLASLYANTSVLENHHWRFALCIFKESQLFDHFDSAMLADMKEQLKHLILATDIARQNEYLKRFREMTSSRNFSMSNTPDRALVLQMALKCADLGNPCRPWMISRVWSNLICDEFYRMGQIERRLGLPLTPICQRDKTSIAGIQTDFFRFIVLPLLELWHGFLASPLSDLLMANFDHNYKRWQRASRIVQQLRRRKSVACLEPLDDDESEKSNNLKSGRDKSSPPPPPPPSETGSRRPGWSLFEAPFDPVLEDIYAKHSFRSVKRASSDYVKSGNGWLESMRDFQLNQTIEKSPQVRRAYKRHRDALGSAPSQQQKPASASKNCSAKSGARGAEQPLRDYSASGLFRQALSPIQDGDSASPDQTGASSCIPAALKYGRAESPFSTTGSSASSACSSAGGNASRVRNFALGSTQDARRRQQQNIYGPGDKPKSAARQSASSSQKGFYNNMRRRESDPGALTDELAAAIVLIQYQSNNLYHKRRSSLPICMSRRRSSK